MAFGGFDSKGPSSTMSEINMVPLIDVMLVLLVIFIITAPLLSHSIRIDVPQVSAQPVEQEPVVVDLAIDPRGDVFWNEQPVAMEDLAARFAQEAARDPQPQVRIRADLDTRYAVLAEIMGAARKAGIKRLGFITRPGDPAAPGAAAGSPAGHAGTGALPAGAGTPPSGAAAPAAGTGTPPAGAATSAPGTRSSPAAAAPAASAAPAR